VTSPRWRWPSLWSTRLRSAARIDFLIDAVLADMIDYDQFLHGDRLEGIFGTTAFFVPKLVAAFANAFPLAIFYTAGFEAPLNGCDDLEASSNASGAKVYYPGSSVACDDDDIRPRAQSEAVVWLIRFFVGGLPVLLGVLSFVVKYHFPIMPSYSPVLNAGIATHKSNPAVAVKDPVSGKWVTWLVEANLSAQERVLKRYLDSFPLALIEGCRQLGSFSSLVRRASISMLLATCWTFCWLLVTGVTIGLGWLSNDQYSLIPTVGCVLTGFGVTVGTMVFIRLRIALHLKRAYPGTAFPAEFLVRYSDRFKDGGDSGAATRTEVRLGDASRPITSERQRKQSA